MLVLVLCNMTSRGGQEIIVAEGRTWKIDVVDLRDMISVRDVNPAREG